jgi:hypothetical protein
MPGKEKILLISSELISSQLLSTKGISMETMETSLDPPCTALVASYSPARALCIMDSKELAVKFILVTTSMQGLPPSIIK